MYLGLLSKYADRNNNINIAHIINDSSIFTFHFSIEVLVVAADAALPYTANVLLCSGGSREWRSQLALLNPHPASSHFSCSRTNRGEEQAVAVGDPWHFDSVPRFTDQTSHMADDPTGERQSTPKTELDFQIALPQLISLRMDLPSHLIEKAFQDETVVCKSTLHPS